MTRSSPLRRISAFAATLVLALGAALATTTLEAGAGTGGPSPTATLSARTTSRPATIVISNFMYHPMRLVVAPGQPIRVENRDSVVHTLTSTTGAFNSGNIPAHGQRTVRAPRRHGVYHYICAIHQFMTGEVVVK